VPVTPFQAGVLRTLSPNRSRESFVAGGIALNAHEQVRWSRDVDVFHDAEDAVIRSSTTDLATLEAAGYTTRQELWTPSFRRAWVSRGDEGVKLEWCRDSAWRFFPIESDELMGWRLHWFDAIANKALAMGSRAETRDLVDIVTYAARCPLHAIVWAACSKDPGFGPRLLLDQMRRNSRVDIAELREMGTTLEARVLKMRWIDLANTAEKEIDRAGTAGVEVGLAFVHAAGTVGWFDEPGVTPHHATLGGAAPRIAGYPGPPPSLPTANCQLPTADR
jgi:hypothetical protein